MACALNLRTVNGNFVFVRSSGWWEPWPPLNDAYKERYGRLDTDWLEIWGGKKEGKTQFRLYKGRKTAFKIPHNPNPSAFVSTLIDLEKWFVEYKNRVRFKSPFYRSFRKLVRFEIFTRSNLGILKKKKNNPFSKDLPPQHLHHLRIPWLNFSLTFRQNFGGETFFSWQIYPQNSQIQMGRR